MDQNKLRNLVFEKTGVKVDSDDPIFALVALNETVLAEAVGRHIALLDEATRELGVQARALQDAGIHRVPSESGERKPHARSASAEPAPAARAAPAGIGLAPAELRLLGLGAALSVLTALLVLGGQALLFKPAPTMVLQAPALTSEQSTALAKGEKLAKAIQRLDQKSRTLIQTEMQKP